MVGHLMLHIYYADKNQLTLTMSSCLSYWNWSVVYRLARDVMIYCPDRVAVPIRSPSSIQAFVVRPRSVFYTISAKVMKTQPILSWRPSRPRPSTAATSSRIRWRRRLPMGCQANCTCWQRRNSTVFDAPSASIDPSKPPHRANHSESEWKMNEWILFIIVVLIQPDIVVR